MVDLSNVPTDQLKAKLEPASKSPLADIPTEQLKARIGGVASQVGGLAKKATSAYERDVLQHQPDIDYSSSAPFSVRVMVERASNPKEVKLELGKFYAPEDFGQDKAGRWWVREGGKKVPVEAGGLSGAFTNLGAKMVSEGTPMAASVLGGAIGAAGGPFAPFTVPLGMGVGAAAGKGVDEFIKYLRGTYAKTPTETVKEVSNEGAFNMAAGGAGQVIRQIAPFVKSKIFGVTPETSARGERLIERGATPPIGSVAPEATGFEAKRKLRNAVSGDPTLAQNVGYVDKEVRQLLKDAGVKDIPAAMEEITSGTKSLSSHEAGESIVGAAQKRIATTEANIEQNLKVAKMSLAAEEKLHRQFASQDVGRLAQDVSDTIVGARREFGRAMSANYKAIHDLTGDRPVIDLTPAIDEAQKIIAVMPKGTVPELITKLVGRNDAMATIEEAHNLRSSLRDAASMANLPNLTPDQTYALYSRVEDAVDGAFKSLAKTGNGLPKEAASRLAKVDAQYREGIAKFRDMTLNKLVRDTKSGLIPDPTVVAQTVMRDGSIERTREILRMVSPEVRDKIAIADMRNTISRSSFLDDKGELRLNGKDLLAELNKHEQVMKELYPPQFLSSLKRFAKELAVADGDIPAHALTTPTAVSDALRKWAIETDLLDKFVKENPLGALRSANPRTVDRALRAISRPGDTKTTEMAMASLDPKERLAVQKFNLKNLLSAAMEETSAGTRQVSGTSIEKELAKYTEKQQDLLFPYGMAGDLRELAKDLRFMFPQSGEYAESMTSMGVKSKGFFNPFALHKRVMWYLSGWLTDRPQVLHWFANLHARDPGAARQIMGGMSRWIANAALAGPSSGKP